MTYSDNVSVLSLQKNKVGRGPIYEKTVSLPHVEGKQLRDGNKKTSGEERVKDIDSLPPLATFSPSKMAQHLLVGKERSLLK